MEKDKLYPIEENLNLKLALDNLNKEEEILLARLKKIKDAKINIASAIYGILDKPKMQNSDVPNLDELNLNKRGFTWPQRIMVAVNYLHSIGTEEVTTIKIADLIVAATELIDNDEIKKITQNIRVNVSFMLKAHKLREEPGSDNKTKKLYVNEEG